ncbi:MAG: Coenzyme F420 hydrogenase/dehydrogenase, beta subunit C-terminal domain [Proteobacteria bacterium]|nr:Coenzyme F420 hydrogenase/dehydrogenase, beta subunit C-terminal domain [Pseudomonadota bacterium]MDA0952202.1 Coenzyme F420 hydrogenase/dehydrogenase, beta subunit C-terminal domain [Pseudomonadota bacterium]
MTAFPDLQTIVAHGLCASCGLCESIAGRERVEMQLTSYSQMRPQVREELDEATMDRIRAVCPGITVTGPDPEQVADKGQMHDIWGPIRTMARGWSTDEDLRFASAAGGAMTALGCYLLETGQVDAVVQVRASTEQPFETDALVSRTPAQVRSGAQSRYGPAAPLRHVMDLLDQGLRFAVLAKPCDVAAIRNLGRIDARVETQVPFLITIFCGGLPTEQTARKVAGYHGVAAQEVSVFRWRGNGWPGPTHTETHDGRVFDLSYDEVWYDERKPWKYDIQFRCKICPDAIGELADVSCPDSWVMVDGKPIHEEAGGANLFIARTKAGEKLVAEAAAAGAIHLEPFSADELAAQHADHVTRKIENPARVRALGLEGEPEPVYGNFRAERMVALAGPQRDAQAEEGARRRIRHGANLEPLA